MRRSIRPATISTRLSDSADKKHGELLDVQGADMVQSERGSHLLRRWTLSVPPVLFRAVVDTASSINAKLEEGLHVVLAAGIFNLDAPLQVKNPNTVILGHWHGYTRPLPMKTRSSLWQTCQAFALQGFS